MSAEEGWKATSLGFAFANILFICVLIYYLSLSLSFSPSLSPSPPLSHTQWAHMLRCQGMLVEVEEAAC